MKNYCKTSLLLVAALLCASCNSSATKAANPAAQPQTGATAAEQAAQKAASNTAPAHSTQPAPAPQIDPTRAMKYVRDVVGFGPRYIGTEAHARTERYIEQNLKSAGADFAADDFTTSTPAGPLPMRNLIGKFPGKKDGIIVIASHYDTLYARKDFVGANDGGSSTGLLLELANELGKQKPRAGYSVWLVFFDGEEAIKEWTDSDSIYGSKHLAAQWQKDSTDKKIKALFLTDMIGDSDLNIDRDSNSTPWLEDLVGAAAKNVGYQSYFFQRELQVGDDHTPFLADGVPCADLIDFDYGYNNVFWHSPQDTMDKLSAHSLQVVGDVVLEAVAMLDRV